MTEDQRELLTAAEQIARAKEFLAAAERLLGPLANEPPKAP